MSWINFDYRITCLVLFLDFVAHQRLKHAWLWVRRPKENPYNNRVGVHVRYLSKISIFPSFTSSFCQYDKGMVYLLLSVYSMGLGQCDQIGRKFLATNLLVKVAWKHWWLLGYFEKDHFMLRLLWHLFGATYGNIWATFLLQFLVTLPSALLTWRIFAQTFSISLLDSKPEIAIDRSMDLLLFSLSISEDIIKIHLKVDCKKTKLWYLD